MPGCKKVRRQSEAALQIRYNPATSVRTRACVHVRFIIGTREIYNWHTRVPEFCVVH